MAPHEKVNELNFFHFTKQELVTEFTFGVDPTAPFDLSNHFPEVFLTPEMRTIPGLNQIIESTEELFSPAANYRRGLERLAKKYRHPEDILPTEIVEGLEKDRVEGVVADLDDYLNTEIIPLRQGRISRSFRFRFPHELPEASFLSVYNTDNYLLDIPIHRVDGLTMLLDPEHSDEYKGFDMFHLFRAGDGNILSYWVAYRGEFRPTTPWSHLQREDYPIIAKFIDIAADSLTKARMGSRREVDSRGDVSIYV